MKRVPGFAFSRRDVLLLGAAGGAGLLRTRIGAASGQTDVFTESFTGVRDAWGPGWVLDGVANLWIEKQTGVLQAATDVYPSDRRAVAYRVDCRIGDGEIRVRLRATGAGAGAVLRRVGRRRYYAAVYDSRAGSLQILRRLPEGETVLAAAEAPDLRFPVWLRFAASSSSRGTRLEAQLADDFALPLRLRAEDDSPELQAAGDPGVVATAESGFRSGPGVPLGIASARALSVTGPGHEFETSKGGEVREGIYAALSTAIFEEIAVSSAEVPGGTAPGVVAATTGVPLPGGARLGVVTDVPAEVRIEVANDAGFDSPFVVGPVSTGRRNAIFLEVGGLETNRRWYWRPRVRRGGLEVAGPVRSFRTLPGPDENSAVTMVVGCCATEFGRTFRHIADELPDVFVWEGDLNYPDAHGPLAQTDSGYAESFKDFLATPELQPILSRAFFATQRDDHDYGTNDAWKGTIRSFGIAPYEEVVNPDIYYSFRAGAMEVWVLDQRRFRDDPTLPDANTASAPGAFAGKSLIGVEQREWFLQGLRNSTAPFRVVCSPDPLYYGSNVDPGWDKGYTAERDFILDFIRDNVSGPVVFVTGDSHSGTVVDGASIGRPGILEVRASPMDIPPPGWVQPNNGEKGVVFSGVGKFYCVLRAERTAAKAILEVRLVRVGIAGWGLPDEERKETVWSAVLEA